LGSADRRRPGRYLDSSKSFYVTKPLLDVLNRSDGGCQDPFRAVADALPFIVEKFRIVAGDGFIVGIEFGDGQQNVGIQRAQLGRQGIIQSGLPKLVDLTIMIGKFVTVDAPINEPCPQNAREFCRSLSKKPDFAV